MTNVLPDIFKGIALFTPGGDLIYGIDPSKQAQWHIHLCLGLQEIWGLADSPHFLVPGYTATVERWLDPQTQQIKAIAEVYPSVQRYIPLLQVLFDLESTTNWHIAPWQEEHCNRAVIETYRQKFPQLWEARDLIVRLDPKQSRQLATEINNSEAINQEQVGGYVFRLFISSDNATAEKNLE
jgi:circadian clock protein KaiB